MHFIIQWTITENFSFVCSHIDICYKKADKRKQLHLQFLKSTFPHTTKLTHYAIDQTCCIWGRTRSPHTHTPCTNNPSTAFCPCPKDQAQSNAGGHILIFPLFLSKCLFPKSVISSSSSILTLYFLNLKKQFIKNSIWQ